MSGWVKLHRSVLEWEWYSDHATTRLFMHLLMTCNHAPSIWRGVQINPGQMITGRKQLALETGLSEQQTRNHLDKLKSTSNITIKSNNHFSIITIVNWHEYQGEQPAESPTNNQQNRQQRTTIKEVKKKELEKDLRTGAQESEIMVADQFLDFWMMWVPFEMSKGNRQAAHKAYLTAIKKGTTHEIIQRASEQYLANCRNIRSKSKHASSWLNQRGWEDDDAAREIAAGGNGRSDNRGQNNKQTALDIALADRTHR